MMAVRESRRMPTLISRGPISNQLWLGYSRRCSGVSITEPRAQMESPKDAAMARTVM